MSPVTRLTLVKTNVPAVCSRSYLLTSTLSGSHLLTGLLVIFARTHRLTIECRGFAMGVVLSRLDGMVECRHLVEDRALGMPTPLWDASQHFTVTLPAVPHDEDHV